MNRTVIATFFLIVLARVTDVTLDTVRTAANIQGRRLFSAVLGFVEAVVYVSAIAKVLLNLDHSVYILAYGLGFALGNCLGIAIEQRLAFGQQMAALYSRKGPELARFLREKGYLLAQVKGNAFDGELTIDQIPIGLSSVPFEWECPDQTYPMQFVAGFTAVSQAPDTLALRPEIGWVVREQTG